VLGLYGPIVLAMIFIDIAYMPHSAYWTFPLFVTGIASWTLFEYFMHRFAFHYEPTTALGQRLLYMFHGIHHHYPHDDERLVMPPITSVLLAVPVFGLFYLLWGQLVFGFFAGFLVGYMTYDVMHYAIHAIKQPPKLLRPIWRHHLQHHYKNPDLAYGVSNRFWDRVFGTLPKEQRASQRKQQTASN
jgi:sterol desaturase/sphingolipid hydroxylase (fatty acid hydroxylase superfamily)